MNDCFNILTITGNQLDRLIDECFGGSDVLNDRPLFHQCINFNSIVPIKSLDISHNYWGTCLKDNYSGFYKLNGNKLTVFFITRFCSVHDDFLMVFSERYPCLEMVHEVFFEEYSECKTLVHGTIIKEKVYDRSASNDQSNPYIKLKKEIFLLNEELNNILENYVDNETIKKYCNYIISNAVNK